MQVMIQKDENFKFEPKFLKSLQGSKIMD